MSNDSGLGKATKDVPFLVLLSKNKKIYEGLKAYNETGIAIKQYSGVKRFKQHAAEHLNVVILDLSIVANDIAAARRRIIRIKQHDATSIVILVGDKDALVDLLRTDMQSVVFRTFSEPISYRQMALSLAPAIKAGKGLKRRLNKGEKLVYEFETDLPQAPELPEPKTTKKPIYVLGALVFFIVIAILLVFLGAPERNEFIVAAKKDVKTNLDESDESEQQIIVLHELAKLAQQEGRIIEPKGESLYDYYEQILKLDTYDVTAYKGKQKIVKWLKKNIPAHIENKRFTKAQASMLIFKDIDPVNSLNEQYSTKLTTAVKKEIKRAESISDISETRRLKRVLQKLGEGFEASQEKLAQLEQEHQLVYAIDQALEVGNISPGSFNSAFNLIVEARRDRSVSEATLKQRAENLSDQFLVQVQQALEDREKVKAKRLLNAVKTLDVKAKRVAELEKQL